MSEEENMEKNMPPVFLIDSIEKSFDDTEVLHDISVHVDEGEVVSIIGPSGSGKSTLLRCATLLEHMDRGELAYDGDYIVKNDENGKSVYADKKKLKAAKSKFGLVFQNFNLFPHYTVMKNIIDAPLHVQVVPRGEVEAEERVC